MSLSSDARPAAHHLRARQPGAPPGWQKRLKLSRERLRSHEGWDPGALPAARGIASACQAPLLAGKFSRLLVDLNRRESLFDPSLAFWRLDPSFRETALRRWHRPFRRAAERTARRLVARGLLLHLSVHSFTPVFKGYRRPTQLGILFDPARPLEKTASSFLKRRLALALPGLKIHANLPYRGWSEGHTTRFRELFPATRYAGLELELNQAWTAHPQKGPRLRFALARACAELAEAL